MKIIQIISSNTFFQIFQHSHIHEGTSLMCIPIFVFPERGVLQPGRLGRELGERRRGLRLAAGPGRWPRGRLRRDVLRAQHDLPTARGLVRAPAPRASRDRHRGRELPALG